MKLFGESSPENLEYKQWVEMARNDPELFENLRREAIDEVIEKAPESHRQRLRSLQWRIDQERRRSTSPLGACVRISRMMWESVAGRGGLLENLSQIKKVPFGQSVSMASAPKAEVVEFRSRVK
ncbi:MAG: DUF3135 domain-containing protein [Gammaproteobacteria bacterium]|nr:DUF3135 domain-containing protein [Gammaproteobacteria bacterium]